MKKKEFDTFLNYTFEIEKDSEEAEERVRRWRNSSACSLVQKFTANTGVGKVNITTGMGLRLSDTHLLCGHEVYKLGMSEVPHIDEICIANPLALQAFQAKWGKRDVYIHSYDGVVNDDVPLAQAMDYISEYVADCREYFITILDKLRPLSGTDISKVPYPLALNNVRSEVNLDDVKSKLESVIYHFDNILASEEAIRWTENR